MIKYISVVILFCLNLSCKKDKIFTIETEFGNMEVKLLESTPKHAENFEKLVKGKFYDDLLFHRIKKGFMIQGGDPESRGAGFDKALGSGGPGYNITAEIGSPHFKGMLSAARLGDQTNPQKESSGSQFFIVQGGPITDEALDAFERAKHIKYTPAQRGKYKSVGGTPMLDGEYTVFGEVISGLEVIDKIAGLEADARERPTKDVKMKIK